MSSYSLQRSELKEVFDAVEDAFSNLGIDYYVIGALARDIWYSKENKWSRATRDADFAILVGTEAQFEEVKEYLKAKKGFQDSKGNRYVLFSPNGHQVDILPFGAIEIDEKVQIMGTGLTSISVNGFSEVYNSGTAEVQLDTGHHFKVASLSSIILLKLIAYDDRPEQRAKDGRDVGSIIEHYFDLEAEHIYEHHSDLFTEAENDMELQEIAATVIGREIKTTIGENSALLQRVKTILETEIKLAEKSSFIINMIAETKMNVEETTNRLKNILYAL
jgi:predicted nucleotidyltransferase